MTPTPHGAPWRRRLSIVLHRWHRRIGVLASLLLIWMAVSGWLLNHTGTLHLADSKLHASWITQRYGAALPMPKQAFITEPDAAHWLAATTDVVVLDGKSIAAAAGAPLGIVAVNDMLFVASIDQLQIFTTGGAIIDTVPASLLPLTAIERVGRGCAGIVIASADKIFASSDGAQWQPCGEAIQWSRSAPLTSAQENLLEPLLQPGVSAERLLLDLHSGRFFGTWGPFVVDALGLGMVLLASTGLWMYTHRRRQRAKT